METSNTTADLRGIDSVGGGVAWASGTNGTVLRTEDGGFEWQTCALPPGAEHLDFRAVQAFDAQTAIVMSSGPGDQSRLYKTTDGCASWKLIFTNPDAEGFWDALLLQGKLGLILGDPVNQRFALWQSIDGASSWVRSKEDGLQAEKGEGAFAASNSSMLRGDFGTAFVTGGAAEPRLFLKRHHQTCATEALPLKGGSAGAGAFSLSARDSDTWVVVGGDYQKPESRDGTAALTHDGGKTWHPATTMPYGYRSSVAYDSTMKTWIAVGPNGTDISIDDGRTWRSVHPNPALHEAPDADRNWNAISLPYVVGPHGRIGKLEMRP